MLQMTRCVECAKKGPSGVPIGSSMILKTYILVGLLYATPQALAEGLAAPAIKSYDKSELRLSCPTNPNRDLGDLAAAGAVHMLNHLGKSLEEPERRQRVLDLSSKVPAKGTYGAYSLSGSGPSQQKGPDIYGMRSLAGLDMQRVIKTEAKNSPQFIALIKMAKVDIKPGSLFAPTPAPAASSDNLRYGLAVSSITIAPYTPSFAAQSDSMEELRYAGHAKVEWSIEPLTETNRRLIFQDGSADTAPAPTAKWHFLKLPSPNFSTSATAEGGSDVTRIDARALPTLRFELSQEDGYYKLTYRTSGQGNRIGAEHTLKAPIAGTIMVGRRFDAQYRLLETAAYELLYVPDLPSLNVHQMHIEQRYTADLSTRMGVSHAIGITARGEARGQVAQDSERPRAYGLKYSHSF